MWEFRQKCSCVKIWHRVLTLPVAMLLMKSVQSATVLCSNGYYTVVASIFLVSAASCKAICRVASVRTSDYSQPFWLKWHALVMPHVLIKYAHVLICISAGEGSRHFSAFHCYHYPFLTPSEKQLQTRFHYVLHMAFQQRVISVVTVIIITTTSLIASVVVWHQRWGQIKYYLYFAVFKYNFWVFVFVFVFEGHMLWVFVFVFKYIWSISKNIKYFKIPLNTMYLSTWCHP